MKIDQFGFGEAQIQNILNWRDWKTDVISVSLLSDVSRIKIIVVFLYPNTKSAKLYRSLF